MSPHHSDQICLKGHKSLGDADRMEIQKYHGPTNGLTWVSAGDKNIKKIFPRSGFGRGKI